MKVLSLFFMSCIIINCTINKKNTKSFNSNEIKVTNSGNISLLNRIRTHPGIYIEGSEETARVYTKGINSINNQKEMLFVLNGIKVGNYTQIAKILNPIDIKNITILRNASDIALYGFNGSGGVILVKTK